MTTPEVNQLVSFKSTSLSGPPLIVGVTDKNTARQFVDLPWRIYQNHPLWVPPLRRDVWHTLDARKNLLFKRGPHALYLAIRDGVVVGRICAGVDNLLNEFKGTNDGYFCLFETTNDIAVAQSLLGAAENFVRTFKVDRLKGPGSPTDGDENRGLLVDGFEYRPTFFQSYNPPYYVHLLETCGYTKALDYHAFLYDVQTIPLREALMEKARRRYGLDTRVFEPKQWRQEATIIHRVLKEAMPPDWEEDVIPPTLDEVVEMVSKLKSFAVPELARFAYVGDRPIGFSLAIPDYNQVLAKMNGRLFPFGWLQFLFTRRKIDTLRALLMFVVPEFQNKGVPAVLCWDSLKVARAMGYRWVDASTTSEHNHKMHLEAQAFGGVHHKTYRIYSKNL